TLLAMSRAGTDAGGRGWEEPAEAAGSARHDGRDALRLAVVDDEEADPEFGGRDHDGLLKFARAGAWAPRAAIRADGSEGRQSPPRSGVRPRILPERRGGRPVDSADVLRGLDQAEAVRVLHEVAQPEAVPVAE